MQGTGPGPGADPGPRRSVGGFVVRQGRIGTPAASPLAQMRLLLVVFSLGVIGCGAVTFLVAPADEEGLAVPVAAGIVLAVGVLGWLFTALLGLRLDCSSAATLVATYRTRFFLRVAFAEAAALAGFVVAVLTYEPWPYFLGLAFTAVGFLRAAPTARSLARDQEALALAGCALDVAATLASPPAPPQPPRSP